jgi:hypothetical protein
VGCETPIVAPGSHFAPGATQTRDGGNQALDPSAPLKPPCAKPMTSPRVFRDLLAELARNAFFRRAGQVASSALWVTLTAVLGHGGVIRFRRSVDSANSRRGGQARSVFQAMRLRLGILPKASIHCSSGLLGKWGKRSGSANPSSKSTGPQMGRHPASLLSRPASVLGHRFVE